MKHTHTHHTDDHSGHLLLLGATGIAGSLILAPYVLPMLGIGSTHTAHRWMSFISSDAAPGFYGTGIAGALQEGIAFLPWVGGALTSTEPVTIPGIGITVASGALTTMLASAVIGIGGTMLANWMEKREQASDHFHWSSIIRTVSLATSILISLPSILTGISIGITFLAGLINTQWGIEVATAMSSNYGPGAVAGAANHGAGTGLFSLIPHLFSCGAALIPASLAMFMASSEKAVDMGVQLVNTSLPIKDKPCRIAFRLVDRSTGRPLSDEDLKMVHEKCVHTMLINDSLTDYHHVHPEYDSATGQFTCSFTPRTNESYSMWNDVHHVHSHHPQHIRTAIDNPQAVKMQPSISQQSLAMGDGLRLSIEADAPLRIRENGILRINVTDASGRKLNNLEPLMGAFAHLVGFSADGQHFIHCHPIGQEPRGNHERAMGSLEFHMTPVHAGPTRFFLQVIVDGKEHTLSFGHVIQREKTAESSVPSPHHVHVHQAQTIDLSNKEISGAPLRS